MFKPYFEASINETIQTRSEERLVNDVLGYNYEQLQQLKDDVNTEVAIDKSYSRSRECTLKCKAAIRRANQLRKLGKYHRPVGIMEGVASFMGGWILADEFNKRNGLP